MTPTDDGVRLAPRWCRCGARMERGLRIGPGRGQRTNTLICWRCGHEEPSLYGRSFAERNPGGITHRTQSYLPGAWMRGRLVLGRS